MKKSMKESGITRTMVIDHIVKGIQKDFNLSKAQATEYFNEALAYNMVVEEIRSKIAYMIEEPEHRLDWSQE